MSRLIITYSAVVLACLFSPLSRMAVAIDCEPEPTDMTIGYGDDISCDWGAGDSDIYRFLGSAGDSLRIDVTETKPSITEYPCVALYDPEGAPVQSDTCEGVKKTIHPVLTLGGVHTILTRERDSSGATYLVELFCLAGPCMDVVPPSTLGFTAVEPCRIVDTRYGADGAFTAGETRGYHTYGDISAQNGAAGAGPVSYPNECPFDLGEHEAVHLNVTVVPQYGASGHAILWPWGESRPSSSWINFKASVQNVANAGTVQTTASGISDPDVSVYASQPVDIIIDVMGYYSN